MEINQPLNLYKHQINIQIRFKDIDKQGHVNNANHLTYFETARSKYYKDVFREKTNWDETGLILAHTEITYKSPILIDDDLFCFTKITRLGSKSFDINNTIAKKENNEYVICAFGKSVMVCFNYYNKETIAIPKAWHTSIQLFEGL